MEAPALAGSIFPEGGHEAPLWPMEGLRIRDAIVVKQLDTASEAVIDHVLSTIMDERKAGTVATEVVYRGSNARRWFDMHFPPALEPVILGAFLSPGRCDLGTIMAWLSMTRTVTRQDAVALGCIVHPRWRDQGLGTTMLAHAIQHASAIYPGRGYQRVYFETIKTNFRVRRIAQKMAMVPAGERVDEMGIKKLLFTSMEGVVP